ncbi:hypothetical protein PAXRUDRAFT_154888 [Paxillus rubicundulus Ve08.2h10]|uniref:Uncharacterized protein n=1 Tax=Paxillus rubicundulus Ve08.2h10 TaxID=930991 RepID=A0A0D0D1L8_9AGAM|nr:hypothetical protein PAXRUDRAFT_154888 [Paxillus rubicundulus Ve08.2h10]
MCQYLECELNVAVVTFKIFEVIIQRDFIGLGPYTMYILPIMNKATLTSTANPLHHLQILVQVHHHPDQPIT